MINLKQFVLDLVKHTTIYTIVCASVTKMSNKKSIKSKILKKSRNLKDICNNKLTKILLKLRKENYVIKFQDNKKLSFIFLYNLLQNKLAILRQYLDNTLIKD